MGAPTLEELRRFGETRSRWSLILAGVQLGVLLASGLAAFTTGFVGYLALGAAWMFLVVRVSRSVVGDRALDSRIRQEVKREQLSGGWHDGLPASLADDVAALEVHRARVPQLSAAMAGVFLVCAVGAVVPAVNVWTFGLAAVGAIAGIGWAWSQRKGWAEARARVDAWAEVASEPLDPRPPVSEPERPRLEVIEGGRVDDDDADVEDGEE